MRADLVSAAATAAGLGPAGIVIASIGEPERHVRIDAGRRFAAASMIKVPIAAALTKAWAFGRYRPDDLLRIDERLMTENDAASPLVPGYEATLEELGRLMLVRSDNVATNALIERLDRRVITADLHELGCTDTFVRRKLTGGGTAVDDPGAQGRNAHPPEDAARLFEAIARGALPGAAWLATTLGAQEWNDKLSAGLSPGDLFAHKTGDTSEASHDGGILTTAAGTRWVLVVYTALPSSAGSDARLGDFMRRVRPSLGEKPKTRP